MAHPGGGLVPMIGAAQGIPIARIERPPDARATGIGRQWVAAHPTIDAAMTGLNVAGQTVRIAVEPDRIARLATRSRIDRAAGLAPAGLAVLPPAVVGLAATTVGAAVGRSGGTAIPTPALAVIGAPHIRTGLRAARAAARDGLTTVASRIGPASRAVGTARIERAPIVIGAANTRTGRPVARAVATTGPRIVAGRTGAAVRMRGPGRAGADGTIAVGPAGPILPAPHMTDRLAIGARRRAGPLGVNRGRMVHRSAGEIAEARSGGT